MGGAKACDVAERNPLIAGASGHTVDRFSRVALLVLVIALAADGDRLLGEFHFLSPNAVVATSTYLPVPQYNPGLPEVNLAGKLAASRLPASAVCVIDRDAWTDDFERMSFLLLPRRLWPVAEQPLSGSASAALVGVAMASDHADCLLARSQTVVPSGLTRLTSAYYSLYVPAKSPGP